MSGVAASVKAMAMRRLLKSRLDTLAEKQLRYRTTDRGEIEAFQTARLKEIWDFCLREVPFYQRWAAEHGLPREIRHLGELAAFPVLTKEVILAQQDLIFQNLSRKESVGTGGTTGEPTRFPATLACVEPSWANAYLGRGWWDIQPFEPIAHIWGHAHLYGTGWPGRVAHLKRKAKDWMLNRIRLSAYDMSPDSIARYAERIARFRPAAVLGYTSVVFRLAQHLLDHPELKPAGLKGVIISSEAYTRADIEVMERAFGAPVIQEYGAGETTTLGYSRPDTGKIHMFWDTFVAIRDEESDIRITTLNPRVFPLINYRLGDIVRTDDPPWTSILTLDDIKGRVKEWVTIGGTDGSVKTISAVLLVHIFKQYPGIRSVAFEQFSERELGVFMEAVRPLDLDHAAAFFAAEIRKVDFPNFDPAAATYFQVDEQQRTPSGKHRLIRARSEAAPAGG